MIAEVRELLSKRPFVRFQIVTTGGNRYGVATVDHADISPDGSQIHIWLDTGGSVTVAAFHIASIEKDAPLPGGVI